MTKMESAKLKTYRKNMEMTQAKLSEKAHIAQNTLSQYESGIRSMDFVTEEHISNHLHVAKVSLSFQLTNQLVRHITEHIFAEDAIGYWGDISPNVERDNNLLLNGGTITVNCSKQATFGGETSREITMDNLFQGYKQWLSRSGEHLNDQIMRVEEGEITCIDEIGINEICQYALFNDLLCDLQPDVN